MTQEIANTHFPEINLCMELLDSEPLFTYLSSLSFTSWFMCAIALHAQIPACLKEAPWLSVSGNFLSSFICCFPLKSLIPGFLLFK